MLFSQALNDCSWNFLIFHLRSAEYVLMSPLSILILVNLCHLFLFSLTGSISISLAFSKKQLSISLIFSIGFLFLISMMSTLYYFLYSACLMFILLLGFQVLKVEA